VAYAEETLDATTAPDVTVTPDITTSPDAMTNAGVYARRDVETKMSQGLKLK